MNDETTDSRNQFNAMENRLRLLEDREIFRPSGAS